MAQVEQLTLFPQDTLANLRVMPGSEKAKKMTVGTVKSVTPGPSWIVDAYFKPVIERLEAAESKVRQLKTALPIDEWHEDIGDVLWWTFPIEEAPYCRNPLDSEWPGYHTHWTPIVVPEKETGA